MVHTWYFQGELSQRDCSVSNVVVRQLPDRYYPPSAQSPAAPVSQNPSLPTTMIGGVTYRVGPEGELIDGEGRVLSLDPVPSTTAAVAALP